MINFKIKKNNEIFLHYTNEASNYKWVIDKKEISGFVMNDLSVKNVHSDEGLVYKVGNYVQDNNEIVFDKEVFNNIECVKPIKRSDVESTLEKMFLKKYGSLIYIRYKTFWTAYDSCCFSQFNQEKFDLFYRKATSTNISRIAYNKFMEDMFKEHTNMESNWNQKYEKSIQKIRNKKGQIQQFELDFARLNSLIEFRRELKTLIDNDEPETLLQKFLYKIIKIIWPNYVKVEPGVFFSSKIGKNTFANEIDFVCLDIDGNIDLIEIKNAKKAQLINKNNYRKEVYNLSAQLTAPISQLNHAINRVSNISIKNRKKIANSFSVDVEDINFNNPRGILIMGRDQDMTQEQKHSFYLNLKENMKIKHFFTYDGLLKIMDNAISIIQKQQTENSNSLIN